MIGRVKFRQSRPIPDGFIIKQIRIVKRASGYFAMLALQCDVEIPKATPHGHVLGIDLGLEKFLATSDHELVPRPRFFVDAQSKLKLLQQRLKHKKLGSKNWHKAQQKVARHHQRISDSRKDFHFKTAHHLCDQAGMIFAEDLDLKTMSKGMLFDILPMPKGRGFLLLVQRQHLPFQVSHP
ncbi:transposase [Synechococcus sp. PCC 6717]|nr:RNA-guided endonuclease TnpB family protein [Thermostichus lividus]MCI3279859.1 transposase [Synechococcus sp. PCC 6717]